MPTSIAIIGAGLAGLTLARRLAPLADVTLFEKSRGLGGRLANRRRGDYAFDHGAQYFTARSERFKAVVAEALAAGSVSTWPEAVPTLSRSGECTPHPRVGETRYVGTPGMTGLANHLAKNLDIRKETTVAALGREDRRWRLRDADQSDLGLFDIVISTAPAPQTATLMPAAFTGHEALARARMSGCFTLMIGLDEPPDLGFDAARLEDEILSFIAIDSSKPGRAGKPALVVHSRNDWAEAHLETDRTQVQEQLLAALARCTGRNFRSARWIDLHRWRYAAVDQPASEPFLFDPDLGLGACGDWCIGNRVEAAFESAAALAGVVSERLADG
ncbi:NAD(P)/FAD-dependent oxidoreductase [Rhizobium wuzhouense]|uniref:NAD(P)/FAD-dependent oxidoreductase n=1 Tax=Rhizobium wuzhouense TaxID=1986026 RepID=UPI0014029CF7|nr:FAD-dependent oxidoreductase [Rhizobium wuzhouense]